MDMDGPLWSLGYEFWFYFLAGLIALAILRGASALPSASSP